MWIPLAIAAGSAISGVLGANKAAQAAKDAQNIRDKSAQDIRDLKTPNVQDIQYDPKVAAYQGDIDPTLQSQLGNISSASNDITTDPRFATAQYQSLGSLADIANSGGMTLQDKLNAQTAQNDASSQASREQGRILQDQAERGMGGSGAELAARLASSQGAANRGAAAAQTEAASAQARALEAIKAQGALSGQMQAASYGQQNTAAAAKDLIAKFNQQNAYNVQQQNQQAANTAATNNQSQRQVTATNAANTQNTAAQYNANANNVAFNNQLAKANDAAAASSGSANSRIAAGNAANNMAGAVATAIPGVATAVGNAFSNSSPKTGDDDFGSSDQAASDYYHSK